MSSLEGVFDRTDALVAAYADRSATVFRAGLGASFLLSGGYKIVEPAVYEAYFAPVFASAWPAAVVPMDVLFLLAGIVEVAFGLLLLAAWHTPTVAAVTVAWLATASGNFVVAVAQGEPAADLLAMHVGLVALAAGVALDAARDDQT